MKILLTIICFTAYCSVYSQEHEKAFFAIYNDDIEEYQAIRGDETLTPLNVRLSWVLLSISTEAELDLPFPETQHPAVVAATLNKPILLNYFLEQKEVQSDSVLMGQILAANLSQMDYSLFTKILEKNPVLDQKCQLCHERNLLQLALGNQVDKRIIDEVLELDIESFYTDRDNNGVNTLMLAIHYPSIMDSIMKMYPEQISQTDNQFDDIVGTLINNDKDQEALSLMKELTSVDDFQKRKLSLAVAYDLFSSDFPKDQEELLIAFYKNYELYLDPKQSGYAPDNEMIDELALGSLDLLLEAESNYKNQFVKKAKPLLDISFPQMDLDLHTRFIDFFNSPNYGYLLDGFVFEEEGPWESFIESLIHMEGPYIALESERKVLEVNPSPLFTFNHGRIPKELNWFYDDIFYHHPNLKEFHLLMESQEDFDNLMEYFIKLKKNSENDFVVVLHTEYMPEGFKLNMKKYQKLDFELLIEGM